MTYTKKIAMASPSIPHHYPSLLSGLILLWMLAPSLSAEPPKKLPSPDSPPIAPPYIPQTDTTQPIRPPFGLNWGESSENTLKWIEQNNHRHIQGTHSDQRKVIEVQGPFPEVTFDRVRFYFTDEQLTEVELQFNKLRRESKPREEADSYTQALELKNLIDDLYGKGHLIRHDQSQLEKENWRYIHQVWTDEEHSIWLIIFHHRTPQQALTMTSVHYRWEKRLQTPPKENQGKSKKMENKKIEKIQKKSHHSP